MPFSCRCHFWGCSRLLLRARPDGNSHRLFWRDEPGAVNAKRIWRMNQASKVDFDAMELRTLNEILCEWEPIWDLSILSIL
jgi:hypothetical protein